ncbi:MAG: type IX secretion system protein PorQ [Chitinophagaceae bacterium]
MRLRCFILLLLVGSRLQAQTLGGNAVFSFLRLPSTPQLSALGGINVSHPSADIGLAFNNPALLKPSMHTQLNAVFNGFYDGITAYHLSFGYHSPVLNTNFAWGLTYLNYGNVQQTDASGNLLGQLRPSDWVMQVSASRSYLEKWNYGASLKFINSNYGQYRSNGIAVDAGVLYQDTASLFSASLLAKNMGTQLKKYDGTDPDDLPFDLQLGMSKRLANSPFGFSVTAHHLHQFDIRYNDAGFNDANGFAGSSDKKITFDKLFRHIVLAANIYLGDKVEVIAGYNYLKRQELNIGGSGNGLTGFSMGVSLVLNKLQVRYARSHYQNNTAYNQFGLNMTLNRYFGLGRFGEKVGW